MKGEMDYMDNIFLNPRKYLQEFYDNTIFSQEIIGNLMQDFKGLSMMCVWLTKLCPLKCEKCFFHSNMNHEGLKLEEYQLSDEGINRLVDFINKSNNGYLMISGGGDPMVCEKHITRLITETKTKRIVIVTSGFWGTTEQMAKQKIDTLYRAYKQRVFSEPCEVVIRLSVDQYHESELRSNTVYKNIVNVFRDNYFNIQNFSLMIHTMRDDKCVEKLAKELGGVFSYGEEGESDNSSVIKIVPRKAYINFDSYTIPIGISKLFLSDLMIDLRPPYSKLVVDAVKVMTDDMENSEQGNPSYIQNALGRKGLDFWVDYNGNITTWFNQDWYQLFNLYTDDYDYLVKKTFANPMTAFFLRKGYEFRNNIISEVNPLALLRAQATNLRDYFAALLLEEDATKLYYGIRTIQSFLNEFFIYDEDLSVLSPDLQKTIKMPLSKLKELYLDSDYDILAQYMNEEYFDKQNWEDLFLLVALGQYKVSSIRLQNKLETYAKITNQKFKDIDSFLVDYSEDLYARLHKRISFMKPKAYEQLFDRKER